jgi:hypothetical protein
MKKLFLDTEFSGLHQNTTLISIGIISEGFVNLSVKNYKKNKEILIVLSDVFGKKVYSETIITDNKGDVVTTMDLKNKIPKGVYLVIGSSGNDVYNQKLVVY